MLTINGSGDRVSKRRFTRAVSLPMPPLPPVTMTVLPVWSGTSAVVQVGLGGNNWLMTPMRFSDMAQISAAEVEVTGRGGERQNGSGAAEYKVGPFMPRDHPEHVHPRHCLVARLQIFLELQNSWLFASRCLVLMSVSFYPSGEFLFLCIISLLVSPGPQTVCCRVMSCRALL
jgi:hypothetical protein